MTEAVPKPVSQLCVYFFNPISMTQFVAHPKMLSVMQFAISFDVITVAVPLQSKTNSHFILKPYLITMKSIVYQFQELQRVFI